MTGPEALLGEAIDAERIAAFAQQLGIAAAEEEDFGWIAEVGLQSPLPPRWTSHTDTGSGFVYYVDHDRQVSSWENPLVPFLRRVVELGRIYLQNPSENFFEEQKGLLWHQHKHDLDCWNGPFTDEEGRQYFINAVGGVSSWQDPRIDAQYIFELESGLLTSLQEVLPAPEPDTPGFGDVVNDGATVWRNKSSSAEVMVLDGERPGTGFKKREQKLKRAPSQVIVGQAQAAAKEEHRGTVEVLAVAADRLHDLQQDDVEAQRVKLARKKEERRQRQLRAAGATTAGASANGLRRTGIEGRSAVSLAPLARKGSKPRGAAPPLPALPGRSRGGRQGRCAPMPLSSEAVGEANDADGRPRAPEDALPPPPPPVRDAFEPANGKDCHDVGPPKQAPSPTAGRKPALARELEQRLVEADRRKRDDGRGDKSSLPPAPSPPFMDLQLKSPSGNSTTTLA